MFLIIKHICHFKYKFSRKKDYLIKKSDVIMNLVPQKSREKNHLAFENYEE